MAQFGVGGLLRDVHQPTLSKTELKVALGSWLALGSLCRARE